ncbi:MAG: M23 family metallopeptidase [Candidatus Zixiibacteriota bacterium]|nr:MAG: M23 family metallopeptidase [candidate division Zixibacteria bacterium]
MDIPTRGKTGYAVLACQSGYVYRLFTSWQGYGKAVYLKLDDGRFAVYGHLSDFSPSLSRMVIEAQVAAKRYKSDFLLTENEIRVNKGEVIGYSGESGWGGTHLHFELRDSTGHPVNPLTSGFSVKDGLPPRIKSLAIRPLKVGARINGSAEPAVFALTSGPQVNLYGLREAPVVEGEIGVELSASDKMDDSRFTFGVYRLELRLDDSLLFSSKYDRFSFENTHKIELDRDFEFRKRQKVGFYKLYVEQGNDLPIYDPAGGRMSTQTVASGPHKAEIRVFDASGNLSVLTFSLIFDQRPSILSCAWEDREGDGGLRVRFHDPDDLVQEIIVEKSGLGESVWEEIKRQKVHKSDGESLVPLAADLGEPSLIRIAAIDSFGTLSEHRYLTANLENTENPKKEDSLGLALKHDFRDNLFIVDLEFNQILRAVPQVSLESGGFDFDPLFLEQLDEKSYRSIFPYYMTQSRELSLLMTGVSLYGDTMFLNKIIPVAIITGEAGGTAVGGDGGAKVEFPSDAVYQDINVSIQAVERSEVRHKLVGKTYSFEPSVVPFDKRAKVSLKYPEGGCDPGRLGLYELIGESSWRFIGQELDTLTRSVAGEVRYLSTYALLEDTLPPKVNGVSISAGKRIREKMPEIRANIKDDLSGIGSDENMVVEIDGEWMIPEYDPEKQILVTRPISPLALGKHLLTIWVRDRAGNETEVKREFFVVE